MYPLRFGIFWIIFLDSFPPPCSSFSLEHKSYRDFGNLGPVSLGAYLFLMLLFFFIVYALGVLESVFQKS